MYIAGNAYSRACQFLKIHVSGNTYYRKHLFTEIRTPRNKYCRKCQFPEIPIYGNTQSKKYIFLEIHIQEIPSPRNIYSRKCLFIPGDAIPRNAYFWEYLFLVSCLSLRQLHALLSVSSRIYLCWEPLQFKFKLMGFDNLWTNYSLRFKSLRIAHFRPSCLPGWAYTSRSHLRRTTSQQHR